MWRGLALREEPRPRRKEHRVQHCRQRRSLGRGRKWEEEEEGPKCRFVGTKATEGPKASALAVLIADRVGSPECMHLNAPHPLLQVVPKACSHLLFLTGVLSSS